MRTTFKMFLAKRKDTTITLEKNGQKYNPVIEINIKYNAEIPSTHRMLK